MLVSAIMPTRGRPVLAQKAVQCFLNQTYEPKELIILDDEGDPAFPKGTEFPPTILYVPTKHHWVVGRKRNFLAERSQGEFIFHFDSDDWSHRDRIAAQLKVLENTGKAVTGFNSMPFIDEVKHKAWQYIGATTYVAIGTSLAYKRDWWHRYRFKPMQVGEDVEFVKEARKLRELYPTPDLGLMVARVHNGNTSKKPVMEPIYYKPMDWANLPEAFLE